MGRFASLEDMILATAEAVRPPERLTVDQAAEKYRYINNPGSSVGKLSMNMTPYLREPMQMLTSLDFTQMSFVGPAQCAKSDMATSWLCYSVICDPADFMHIDKSQSSARDWHMRRNEKFFRDTPEVKSRMLGGKHNSSTYSTRFTSGMLFTMSWPTVAELSGKPVGRLWLADYDRMPEDIGGEGSAFDLAVQRMKSFKRFGMCAAESSPSRTIENSRWMPETKHQAPPTTGILALYNRGDRRRWYWPCLACGDCFEPCFTLFEWPDDEDSLDAAEKVVMPCPHCGHQYRDEAHPESGTPSKRAMNMRGFWLKDGESVDKETGEITGTPIRSRMASFWLKGPAAAFADWTDMTLKYIKAVEEFEKTGSEEALKTTVNTDQGLPYLPAGLEAERLPEELKARSQASLGEKTIPEGVRFLIATVDTQKRRFEVQIHGIMKDGDVVVIDRFKIRKANRLDEDGDPLPLNPGAYVEDWHTLVDQVLEAKYELGDDSGRLMQIRMLAVDSGGAAGVTANAYEFWRQLRADGRNLHRRVQLLKGEAYRAAPLVRIDYPNAERKDRRAAARGEVPVMMINVNEGKDMVNNMLARTEPGGGMVFFPEWLPDWWYVELCAETKTGKGWVNPGSARNEAWDLLVYCMALCHSSKIRLHHINWEDPPGWAREWDENDLVYAGENFRFETKKKSNYDLSKLADTLG